MSSSVIFSSSFLREVACFDFDALALNRWMKVCSSLIFSSFFLFASYAICRASWLDLSQYS